MTTWHLEYESFNSGYQKRKIVAHRMSADDDFLTFWEGHTPVLLINKHHLILCVQLAEDGIVRAAKNHWRTPHDEEEVILTADLSSWVAPRDPIGDAARDVAQRLRPKYSPAPVDVATLRPAAPVQGELGENCA